MQIKPLAMNDLASVRAESAIPLSGRYDERSTYEVLRNAASMFADHPALTFLPRGTPDESPVIYRYSELVARVTQAANAFHRLGLGPGDTVAYLLPNLPQTHFTIWGGETAGRVAAVNPLLEPEQIRQILRAVRARLLVTLVPGLPDLDPWTKCGPVLEQVETLEHVLCVDPARLFGARGGPDRLPASGRIAVHDFDLALDRESGRGLEFERHVAPDDIASLFHTGGTTGMPKVAPHTQANEVFTAWAVASTVGTEPADAVFCALPLFHVNAPLATGLAVWAAGANVVLATAGGYRTPGLLGNLWALIARYRVTAMMAVPTIYAALLEVPVANHDISSLRNCMVGAAPMPQDVFRRFRAMTGLRILEGYGMTEGTAVSSINPVGGDRRVGSIGLPLPYAELEVGIVDNGRIERVASAGEIGHLLMRGPNVFRGYLEATHNAGAWVEDAVGRRWFDSGDLARTDEDGYLWLAGRAKDLIIRGGHNIDPQLIEESLAGHPDVALAAAVGQPDAYAGELPMVYVQPREGAEISADALREFAAARIPERAAVPVRVELLRQMPLTAVGKIFKPRLRQLAIEHVLGTSLREAGIAASVQARSDTRHGTLARVCLENPGDREVAAETLARFAVAVEFVSTVA
jgi:fatty-acyl-CoA synthase